MRDLRLVTGSTGLIGRYLVERLLAGGSEVRVLARDPGRLPVEWRDRVEIALGDLRDPAALASAVRGVSLVYHLAALARAWSRDPDEFAAINVRGVATLLREARAAGVRRVVHVSTILTLPPWRPAAVRGTALRPTAYESTKKEGERLVEQFVAQGGDAVIVHPTRVYGPGPLTDANGVLLAVARHLEGRLPFRLADRDVLANYVHADDVAQALVLAGERGVAGGRYLAAGENASWAGVLALARQLAGIERRLWPLPARLALALGWLGEVWGRLGGTPSLTRGWIRSFLEDRRVDVGPTVAALGYRPRPLAQGLEETITWLRQAERFRW